MKKIQIIIAVTVLLTGFIACSSPANKEEKKPEQQQAEVKKLPAFTITDVNGNVINTNDFKGKKVFVNLWASWCPPCRAEIPSIEKLKTKMDPQKVAFVMLSLDKNFEVAKEFAKSINIQLPVYYPAEKLPELFNIEGIPATFIFNEKGELIKENSGADDYDTDAYVQLLKG
mgnify:CR=1 FL=1